jgi:uncharacterized repeat protein (TIGR03803 family)
VQAGDGYFYSVATNSSLTGASGPVIFKVSPSGEAQVVYKFPTTFSSTEIGLTAGSDGYLYGVLTNGGTYSTAYSGQIFKVSPFGELTILHSFSDNPPPGGDSYDGVNPLGVLVQGSDGSYYGTTVSGGAGPFADGTVFKISPSGAYSLLYSFCSEGGSACTDGLNPEAGLVQGIDGNFYGSTTQGGLACSAATGSVPGCGTIFKITPSGTLTVVHKFTGGADGAFPGSRLVQGADGNFYGTAQTYPFDEVSGLIFKATPTGQVSRLASLSSIPSGGGNEYGVFLASDGNFYGTKYYGGKNQCMSGYNIVPCGSIYRVSPSGTGLDVYSFMSSPDGAFPLAPPIQGADGSLYGTTEGGGAFADNGNVELGTVYKLAATPSLPPPVALTLSKPSIGLGDTLTLDWSVANAYSMTMQQCYASVQGLATGAGNWSGLQKGIFDSQKKPPFSGSAMLTPTANGTFTYALTCGGMESGFATLTVGDQVASPAFYPPGGGYAQEQKVNIVDSTPSATIYYTLDGSTPTETSTPYTGAIAIGKDTTLKAVAVAASLENSSVASAAYIILLPQTIAFTQPPSPQSFGAKPLTLVAKASSGLPVTFSVVSGPATIAGSTLTTTGVGSVVVAANQSGNGVYSAAQQITRNIVVNKGTQTITFTKPASPITYSTKPITLSAKSTSNLPVTFTVLSGPGKITGDQLTLTAAGTVTIAANQAGNATYAAAPEVKQTIVVDKAAQSIAFTAPASPVNYGSSNVSLSASSSSSLPVSFAVVSGPGRISGSKLAITGAGTIVIAANQPGNSDYAPAAQVETSIVVRKAVLIVAANNLTVKEGEALPSLTCSFTGFVDEDTKAKATTGKVALTTTATSKSAPGTYPITVKDGTLAAANYIFKFVNGTVIVTK